MLSKRQSWKWVQFTLEANMSITRSGSAVSAIRRRPHYLVPCTPRLQIRPCFRKEFWNKRPHIHGAIFILNSTPPLEFAVERRYWFPAVQLFIGYITLMGKMWIKFYFETHGRTYDSGWSPYLMCSTPMSLPLLRIGSLILSSTYYWSDVACVF